MASPHPTEREHLASLTAMSETLKRTLEGLEALIDAAARKEHQQQAASAVEESDGQTAGPPSEVKRERADDGGGRASQAIVAAGNPPAQAASSSSSSSQGPSTSLEHHQHHQHHQPALPYAADPILSAAYERVLRAVEERKAQLSAFINGGDSINNNNLNNIGSSGSSRAILHHQQSAGPLFQPPMMSTQAASLATAPTVNNTNDNRTIAPRHAQPHALRFPPGGPSGPVARTGNTNNTGTIATVPTPAPDPNTHHNHHHRHHHHIPRPARPGAAFITDQPDGPGLFCLVPEPGSPAYRLSCAKLALLILRERLRLLGPPPPAAADEGEEDDARAGARAALVRDAEVMRLRVARLWSEIHDPLWPSGGATGQ